MCCFAVSQLLVLGKSIISRANNTEDEADDDKANVEWPEDVSAKANIIRINAQTMIGYVKAVSHSFITGWLPTDFTLYHHHILKYIHCICMPRISIILCSLRFTIWRL